MAKKHHEGTSEDSEIMKSFNYKQELRRSLKLFGAFAASFSAISITTGIFLNYSFVLKTAGAAGIWVWPIVSIGTLLVALVFAELSSIIPISGYSYQWVKRLANPGVGWFTGWVSFCFLFIVTPSIDGSLAPVFADLFGIKGTATNLMLIAMGALTLQMIINIVSIRLSSTINNIAVYTEVIGIIGLTVILAIIGIVGGRPAHNLIDTSLLTSKQPFILSFAMASLIGFYTLVGFEVSANLSEETSNAHKTVPKAVILSVLISGIFGTLFLAAITFAIKDMGAIVNSASPIPQIIGTNLGPVFGRLFEIIVCISIFACGLVCSTSATRIVYVMSRDNAFFASFLFKKVSNKTYTPIPACVLLWVLGILSLYFASSITILALAASVLPAIYYLITVVSYGIIRKNVKPREDGFTMGKMGTPVIIIATVWLVFEICILSIPKDFHQATLVNGVIVVLGIIIYFAYFKRKIAAQSKSDTLSLNIGANVDSNK